MPLIRAIGQFFQRRANVGYSPGQYSDLDAEWRSDFSPTPYAETARPDWRGDDFVFRPMSSVSSGLAWGIAMLVALPVIAFLYLVGLIYEVLIRVTFHKLPPMSDWTLSLLAAAAIFGVGGMGIARTIWPS